MENFYLRASKLSLIDIDNILFAKDFLEKILGIY